MSEVNQEQPKQSEKTPIPAPEKKRFTPDIEVGIGAGKREMTVDDDPEIPVRHDPQTPPSVPVRETTPPQA